jgi:hypothetical protein
MRKFPHLSREFTIYGQEIPISTVWGCILQKKPISLQ